jgi:uncharacterized protein (TIGR02118 family)
MIKMSLFLQRRPDLTFEQFSDYWMNKHWPIVQSVPAVKEHTIAYKQQHSIGNIPEGLPAAPFDGYAEAWFEEIADVAKVVGSPEWASVVQKDDLNFIDASKTLILFTEEKIDFRA